MKVGDKVRKKEGYGFPGYVVAVYRTLSNEERVVVECTVPGASGWQHIFRPDQLEVVT